MRLYRAACGRSAYGLDRAMAPFCGRFLFFVQVLPRSPLLKVSCPSNTGQEAVLRSKCLFRRCVDGSLPTTTAAVAAELRAQRGQLPLQPEDQQLRRNFGRKI